MAPGIIEDGPVADGNVPVGKNVVEVPTEVTAPVFHHHRRLVPRPQSARSLDAATKTDFMVAALDEHGSVHAGKHLGFEYQEHSLLGDGLVLAWYDGSSKVAGETPFSLPNGVKVTYGQINGLAGDFYGTYDPISDGKTLEDQSARFKAAFDQLANDRTRQPEEANNILNTLKKEVDAVNQAIKDKKDPSEVYANLPDQTTWFQYYTIGRKNTPGYIGLAAINFDHFGSDARMAYNAGHWTALKLASSGKNQDLVMAYAMNAFSDHFLEDSFSAGHMRTPRRYLHDNYNPLHPYDLLAKHMHDEDNAIGLDVDSPKGQSWHAYGDKRLLDKEDVQNLNQCWNALRTSADEVFDAWKSKKVIDPSQFQAWQYTPTLASANAPTQTLVPLFLPNGERREDVKNRRLRKFTKNWIVAETELTITTSGLWKYPITMTG